MANGEPKGCPVCGRVYCDHTPAERGQTHEEMMADMYGMTVEEYKLSLEKSRQLEK